MNVPRTLPAALHVLSHLPQSLLNSPQLLSSTPVPPPSLYEPLPTVSPTTVTPTAFPAAFQCHYAATGGVGMNSVNTSSSSSSSQQPPSAETLSSLNALIDLSVVQMALVIVEQEWEQILEQQQFFVYPFRHPLSFGIVNLISLPLHFVLSSISIDRTSQVWNIVWECFHSLPVNHGGRIMALKSRVFLRLSPLDLCFTHSICLLWSPDSHSADHTVNLVGT